jgi:FAD/FMN-containing dehydrogenase
MRPAPPGEFARALRDGLVATLAQAGAVHVQMAKTYAYESRLTPAARQLWQSIKRTLDPGDRLNPGNLRR